MDRTHLFYACYVPGVLLLYHRKKKIYNWMIKDYMEGIIKRKWRAGDRGNSIKNEIWLLKMIREINWRIKKIIN